MPYYPDEVTEVRLPAGFRVQRAKRRKQRRIVTAAVFGLAVALLVVVPAARSWAHTIDVAVKPVCVEGKVYQDVTVNSQRGDYRFAGTATDSEGHSVPVTIGAGGGSTTVRLGPVSGPGQANVVGDFYKESGRKAEHMDRTVRYRLLDDCKPVTTTTTNPTPTTTPERDDTQTGTATDQSRESTPDDSPELGTPPAVDQPQPGTLPFTGPRDWLLPVGLGLFVAGAAMVLAGRRRFRRLTVAEKAVHRALNKPYNGPHERL